MSHVRRTLLCGVLCALLALGAPARALSTSAACAILMDADSGRVLYAHNDRQPRPIASITKLMTALVAVQRAGSLDETVVVDPRAVGVEGSSMYLTPGEELTLRTLLYGLLLQSGNDAAVAIAIHCAGDVDTFVGWMNDAAQALGMTQTHFVNPNGLEDKAHYSTAYDMALLGQAVLRIPDLAQITATRSITVGERTLVNHNKLLWRYEGCVGLKTGYTQAAGRTLVSAATRGDVTLVAVTLQDGNDWADHAALFNYGFQTWHSQLLAFPDRALALLPVEGSLVRAVPVAAQEERRCCLTQDEAVTAQIDLPPRLTAPVEAGQEVGRLRFFLHGAELVSVPLVATVSAPADRAPRRTSLWSRLSSLLPAALAPVPARQLDAVSQILSP